MQFNYTKHTQSMCVVILALLLIQFLTVNKNRVLKFPSRPVNLWACQNGFSTQFQPDLPLR